ncbi:MAG TPA: CvpA family protein [Phenylobacterium sp.]|nr:CvpA family protein [Phenylobacterium sp.]
MPWFDIIVFSILVASAGLGFIQGATREMVSVIALLIAAVAAIYGLRITGPIGRDMIDPDWAGTVAALAVTFVVVYAALRLLGAGFTRGIQQAPVLGILDRTVGLGFGLVRALVFLGACNLAFMAATPPSLTPKWLAGATFYPMTQAAGVMLRAFAPKGLDMAGKLTPALGAAVRDGSANRKGDSAGDQGYDARDRGGIDDLVEKSR